MKGELERLVFELSIRALERQERLIEELRARTGTLLTAAALVTSLLGTRALSRSDHGFLAFLGVAAAVGTIAASVYILIPKRALEFTTSGSALYEHFASTGASLDEAHRTLAYWNDDAWDTNQGIINRLTAMFTRACASLATAIVFWSLSLTLD
jgi:hypothetical protein